MSDRRIFCSCAITGAMSVPRQSAAIPVTPQEIVDSAVDARLRMRVTLDRRAASNAELVEEAMRWRACSTATRRARPRRSSCSACVAASSPAGRPLRPGPAA